MRMQGKAAGVQLLLICFVLFTDKRESVCYLDVRGDYRGRGLCSNDLGEMSRSTCCCSIGAGWGPSCQLCPRPKTGMYCLHS